MNPSLLSSAKQDWRTPPEVLDVVREAFGGAIDSDPCPSPNRADWFARWNFCPSAEPAPYVEGQPVGCRVDGLAHGGAGWYRPDGKRVFVNPPFSENKRWVANCVDAAYWGCEVILLIPARTDTRYWQEGIVTADALCFWRGRIRFVGAPASAPFATAFAYWGPNAARFAHVFRAHGAVYDSPPWRQPPWRHHAVAVAA